ncbi:MAG TPA: hypothetical protein VGC45_02030 [Gryllotalpicola sp.]
MTHPFRLPSRRRRALAGILALGCAVALTGCVELSAAEQPPRDALTTTTFAPTLAAAQKGMRSVHLELRAAAGKTRITITADVAKTAHGTALRESFAGTGLPTMDLVRLGTTSYLKAGKLTHGGWQKVDLGDKTSAVGKALDGTDPTDGLDPATMTAELKDAISFVQPSGSPKVVDGERTIPYIVVVNTAKALELSGPLAELTDAVPAQLSYDWWIGDDGLPRRYTVVADGISQDVRFSKWNDDITITDPTRRTVALVPGPASAGAQPSVARPRAADGRLRG